jgi:hypothetical protein
MSTMDNDMQSIRILASPTEITITGNAQGLAVLAGAIQVAIDDGTFRAAEPGMVAITIERVGDAPV